MLDKYPYSELKRTKVNGKRLYATETGPLPSVTTILDRTKPAEKVKALNEWKNRVGHAEAQRIVTEAANVGTIMHDTLERWIKGEEPCEKNNLIHQIGKRMADTIIENIQDDLNEVWGSEVNLYYPGLYAGTTDLSGVWKTRDSICDFKQTNRPKKREWIDDYFIQGAAYGEAHNALFGTNIRSVAIFMCSRDCEFQLFEMIDEEYDFWAQEWTKRVEQFYNLK